MSNLYNELKNNNKVANENIQNECNELCLKIESNIKQRALNGFKSYRYKFYDKLDYNRFSCGIVEYFKNKGVYCKRYYCVEDDGYFRYNAYYIDFKWGKTLKEYEKCKRIKNIIGVTVFSGMILGIIYLLF